MTGVTGHLIYHEVYWAQRPSQKTVSTMMYQQRAIGRIALHSQMACQNLRTFYLAQTLWLPTALRRWEFSLPLQGQVRGHKYREELHLLLFNFNPLKAAIEPEIYDALHDAHSSNIRAGALVGLNLVYDELILAFKDKGISDVNIYPWRLKREVEEEMQRLLNKFDMSDDPAFRISLWDTYRQFAESCLATYHELLLEDKLAAGDLNLHPKIVRR